MPAGPHQQGVVSIHAVLMHAIDMLLQDLECASDRHCQDWRQDSCGTGRHEKSERQQGDASVELFFDVLHDAVPSAMSASTHLLIRVCTKLGLWQTHKALCMQ